MAGTECTECNRFIDRLEALATTVATYTSLYDDLDALASEWTAHRATHKEVA